MSHAIHDDRHNETYYPIDETQVGCDGNCTSCTPRDCPQWRDSAFVCPACLEFKERAYPLSKFTEHKLMVREDGRFLCVECDEKYKDTADLATRTLDTLKDALNDAAWDRERAEFRKVAA